MENVTGRGYLKKPEWGIGGRNEGNVGNDGIWGIRVGMQGIGVEIILQISLWKMKLKVKHVKPIKEKLEKFYLQVITNVCVKTAVLEICSEKKTRESVVETFKNKVAVAVHYWYIKDAFAGFC